MPVIYHRRSVGFMDLLHSPRTQPDDFPVAQDQLRAMRTRWNTERGSNGRNRGLCRGGSLMQVPVGDIACTPRKENDEGGDGVPDISPDRCMPFRESAVDGWGGDGWGVDGW